MRVCKTGGRGNDMLPSAADCDTPEDTTAPPFRFEIFATNSHTLAWAQTGQEQKRPRARSADQDTVMVKHASTASGGSRGRVGLAILCHRLMTEEKLRLETPMALVTHPAPAC
jgi:hypothetical protein